MTDRGAKYWSDVLLAISGIESHVEGISTLNQYVADRKTKRVVEREMAIIGEAINQLMRLDPSFSLPDAVRIVSMRKRLVHSYDNIDDPIVWGVVRNHLPVLKAETVRRTGRA